MELLLTDCDLFAEEGLAVVELLVTERERFVVVGRALSALLRVVLDGRELDRTWALEELVVEGRLRFDSLDRFPAERAERLVLGRIVLAEEV